MGNLREIGILTNSLDSWLFHLLSTPCETIWGWEGTNPIKPDWEDRPLGVSHFGAVLDADFEGNLDFVECWNRC